MTTTSYFTLTNSNDSLEKRFKVIQSGYAPIAEKSQTIRKTLDGNLDVSVGAIYDRHEYVIKVTEAVADSDYGTLDDLETFYRYNNPNGVPSNIVTLTDHYGGIHDVVMSGTFSPQPLGVLLEGNEAYYVVQCVFNFLPEAS